PQRRYLTVVSGASLAMGIQVVLLPWLALGQLDAVAAELGWVQASVLIPSLLLMLAGGVMADRYPSARYLAALYFLLALCHLALAVVLHRQQLTLLGLIGYGLCLGALNAFIQPLRERLLASVSNSSLQRSVTWVNFFQYGLQASGVALAGQLDRFGLMPVLALQVLALLLAAAMCLALGQLQTKRRDMAAWAYGVKAVWQNRVTRSLTLLVSFNGFMHIGVFVVVLPLLVRDVYGRSADFYAWLQLSFVAGTLSATVALLRRREVLRPGKGVLLCLFYAALLLFAISAGPKLEGLFLLVYIWGVLTGVSASLGRGLMQQQSPESLRGRMLSLYQLALFGSAPLGAIAAGYGAQHFGLAAVLQISGAFSLLLFCASFLFPALWRVDLTAAPEKQSSWQ
ncbi:MAG: MFS transporter, partial [Cellvibrionaceae bacterium]|nr:MFS transporter [Cellvibrionaceae bacterium]